MISHNMSFHALPAWLQITSCMVIVGFPRYTDDRWHRDTTQGLYGTIEELLDRKQGMQAT